MSVSDRRCGSLTQFLVPPFLFVVDSHALLTSTKIGQRDLSTLYVSWLHRFSRIQPIIYGVAHDGMWHKKGRVMAVSLGLAYISESYVCEGSRKGPIG